MGTDVEDCFSRLPDRSGRRQSDPITFHVDFPLAECMKLMVRRPTRFSFVYPPTHLPKPYSLQYLIQTVFFSSTQPTHPSTFPNRAMNT